MIHTIFGKARGGDFADRWFPAVVMHPRQLNHFKRITNAQHFTLPWLLARTQTTTEALKYRVMEKGKYFISIGDPWDFESPDGPNIINGTIVKVLSDHCLVFKSDYHLNFEDVSGNIIILTPRHEGFSFANLSGGMVTINGGILLKDYDENLNENSLQNNAKFVITGSIRSKSVKT